MIGLWLCTSSIGARAFQQTICCAPLHRDVQGGATMLAPRAWLKHMRCTRPPALHATRSSMRPITWHSGLYTQHPLYAPCTILLCCSVLQD